MSLWDAVECCNVMHAREICADEQYDVNELKSKDLLGWTEVTPLIWCAYNARCAILGDKADLNDEHVQIMRIILQHPKCHVNLQDQKMGLSALHWVCRTIQSVSAARLLLAHLEIDLRLQDERGFTVLHRLMDNMREDNVSTAEAIFNELVKHPTINDCVNKLDTRGFSALHNVCKHTQSVRAAELLLSHPDIDLSLQDNMHEFTVLHTLIYSLEYSSSEKNGNTTEAILDELVKHPKINDCVNILDYEGQSVLHHVCSTIQSVSAARLLLALPDIDLSLLDKQGSTVLHTLMDNMCEDNVNTAEAIFDELVKHRKINDCVNKLDTRGGSALHNVCTYPKSVRAARLLLSHPDIDLSLQDNNGFTVLHRLIGHLEHVSHEKDVNTSEAILDELVKHPKINDCVNKLDNNHQSALDIFITSDKFNAHDIDLSDALKHLFITLSKAHAKASLLKRTLPLAGTLASPQVFSTLIKQGANIDDSLENGETTAFCVISRNSLSKCRSLFQYNPVLTTWNYLTPSQLANEYSCKDEIKQLIRTSSGESNDYDRLLDTNQDHCNESPDICRTLSTINWKHFKTHCSSNIRLDEHGKYSRVWNNHDSLISITYHRYFITESTQHIAEINYIENAIMDFFGTMSTRFANSSKHRHMAYKHFLCGSMGDGTKCFYPDEFDIDCVFDQDEYYFVDHRSWGEIKAKPGSEWREHCDARGNFVVRDAAQAFYKEFARLCHEHNTNLHSQTRGIVKVLFQYMSKISRLKLTWNGHVFSNLCIYVDVVPIFKAIGHKKELPLGVKSNTFYALAKTSRHGSYYHIGFPISVSDAEARAMRALPEPIRQGFTTAKAARQASICAPGIDLQQYNVVEDLSIEDYLTSHSLKNCLLNVLQMVRLIQYTTTTCKYVIADQIYEEFQTEIEKKRMRCWYDDSEYSYLLDCTDCKGDFTVCCHKRKIRLALVTQIRAWLTNPSNLRFLHGSDQCTCTYSQTEVEEYHMKMDRLRQTGKLIDEEAENQPAPLSGPSSKSAVQSTAQSRSKLSQDSSNEGK